LDWYALRQQMVDEQLIARGIHNTRVLHVMRHLPRHIFVPEEYRHLAYEDNPLPIGDEQTISQPFIVALMTQLLALEGHERILEIGTGCGYQTAILAYLAKFVYSLERLPALAHIAQQHLIELALVDNVKLGIADGSYGLGDKSPFDAIIVTAGAPHIPQPLLTQLGKNGGRLIIPVGVGDKQELVHIQRQGDEYVKTVITPVRFVPLVGKFGFKPPPK